METLSSSLKYAIRVFFKRKRYSVVVILMLTTGIGTSSFIFSFVNSVLFGSMLFRGPDKLMIIESVHPGQKGRISPRKARDMMKGTISLENLARYASEAQYN